MKPIVIVGGGPVGLVLSLVLTRFGVSTLVSETREEPTPRDESRAITWMPKGLELLDWLEISEGFDRLGVRRVAHEFWSEKRRLLRMPFDKVRSPYRYTLQLPQHDSEVLLEEAALRTGMVEVRRGHRVVRVGQGGDRTLTSVEGPDGDYDLAAPRAVACDGAGSGVRRMLCIETRWRDYGTDSAVADFGMECDLPKEVSRIVLDPRRPYGFFYFAPGRWRFIYRLNDSEDRRAMITEDATTELLKWKLPSALAPRFLWAERLPAGTGAERELPRGTLAARWRRGTRDGSVRGAGMMVEVLGSLAARVAARAGGPRSFTSGATEFPSTLSYPGRWTGQSHLQTLHQPAGVKTIYEFS